ncbi:MAG: hypothetical protein NC085_00345, partial [Muribaculaceae bacterium]|nr:hypothetical protein [Muribaculaceae bacterium]
RGGFHIRPIKMCGNLCGGRIWNAPLQNLQKTKHTIKFLTFLAKKYFTTAFICVKIITAYVLYIIPQKTV